VIPEGRIVGGLESGKANFPYHVSIRDRGNHHLCNGAIIGSNWVVTSANCPFLNRGDETPTNVVAGALFRTRGGTPYDIAEIIPHPFFNWNLLNNEYEN
jgi:secreted trypsin-like serine protease